MHFLYNIFSPEPYDFDIVIEVLESIKTFQKSTEKRERVNIAIWNIIIIIIINLSSIVGGLETSYSSL